MSFLKNVTDKFNGLAICEQRAEEEDYNELIFFSKDLEQWYDIFVEFLGDPAKPAGVEPCDKDLVITDEYGGICGNQTLFYKEFDEGVVVVMLWPWQDKVHTTLKVIFLKKAE
ncbi:MAG: hypothetical protein GY858_04250 [Candidatus Omnitrophica bacterium]|nr:hypothetical protein [Candidatus Omnitrophota bacterium]